MGDFYCSPAKKVDKDWNTKVSLQPHLFSEAMGISLITGSKFRNEQEVENSSLAFLLNTEDM